MVNALGTSLPLEHRLKNEAPPIPPSRTKIIVLVNGGLMAGSPAQLLYRPLTMAAAKSAQ
jgi:hypothetical protein